MDGQTKEEVYDAEVYPLMAQIIAICKRNKIAMLASFTLDLNESLQCTTALLDDEYEPHRNLLKARDAIYKRQPSCLAITIEAGGQVKSGVPFFTA